MQMRYEYAYIRRAMAFNLFFFFFFHGDEKTLFGESIILAKDTSSFIFIFCVEKHFFFFHLFDEGGKNTRVCIAWLWFER